MRLDTPKHLRGAISNASPLRSAPRGSHIATPLPLASLPPGPWQKAGRLAGVLAHAPWALLLQARAAAVGRRLAPQPHVPSTIGSSHVFFTSATSDIGRVRAATRATVTDILLTALSGALRASLGPAAATAPLLAFLPVMSSSPNLGAALTDHDGNTVSGVLVALPTDQPDAARRLACIVRQTRAIKRGQVAALIGWLARLSLRILPHASLPFLVPTLADHAACAGISSLRGPDAVHVGGAPADTVRFFGAFVPARMPIMIGAASVADRLVLTLGLHVDVDRAALAALAAGPDHAPEVANIVRDAPAAEAVLACVPGQLRELCRVAAAEPQPTAAATKPLGEHQ